MTNDVALYPRLVVLSVRADRFACVNCGRIASMWAQMQRTDGLVHALCRSCWSVLRPN